MISTWAIFRASSSFSLAFFLAVSIILYFTSLASHWAFCRSYSSRSTVLSGSTLLDAASCRRFLLFSSFFCFRNFHRGNRSLFILKHKILWPRVFLFSLITEFQFTGTPLQCAVCMCKGVDKRESWQRAFESFLYIATSNKMVKCDDRWMMWMDGWLDQWIEGLTHIL